MKSKAERVVAMVLSAKQADSSILYAARWLARRCKRCRCNFCGNRPHLGKFKGNERD